MYACMRTCMCVPIIVEKEAVDLTGSRGIQRGDRERRGRMKWYKVILIKTKILKIKQGQVASAYNLNTREEGPWHSRTREHR